MPAESDTPVDEIPRRVPRMPAWMIARPGEHLTIERLRSRLAAYVYGNILTLAAIAIATGESIISGEATVIVAATTLTTYLAHVIAHDIGERLGRERGAHRSHVTHELRDALPIVFSGVVPVIVLVLGDLGLLSSPLAQLLAALWVVSRLAFIGFLIERLNGRTATWRTFSGGLVLAAAAALVVILKVVFAH